jgi:type IV secretion system protein VirB9
VKPKTTAHEPNNLAVVTDQRVHAFRFVVLADGDARLPVYRLTVRIPPAPSPAANAAATPHAALVAPSTLASLAATLPAANQQLVNGRLIAAPQVVNQAYSIAEGPNGKDIVPTLVFDDGRFTYFRFPNNREVPAVFQVMGDGSEAMLNARMDGDLLVVDRVARRLMLRAGSAAVGVWNDAFDIDGIPPTGATTVAGVKRLRKAEAAQSATHAEESP